MYFIVRAYHILYSKSNHIFVIISKPWLLTPENNLINIFLLFVKSKIQFIFINISLGVDIGMAGDNIHNAHSRKRVEKNGTNVPPVRRFIGPK
jgi:hypothetical protein